MNRHVCFVFMITMLFSTSSCQDNVGTRNDSIQSDIPNASNAFNNHNLDLGTNIQDANFHDMFAKLVSEDDGGLGDMNVKSDMTATRDMMLAKQEWSDEELFTIFPRIRQNHGTRDDNFCQLAIYANTIAIVRIIEKSPPVVGCSENPYNPYRVGFSSYRVKQLLHIGGERLVEEFEVIDFLDYLSEHMEPEKTYIIGLLKINDTIYSHGNYLEILKHDASKESERVVFSGKRESLESMAQSFINGRPESCFPSGKYYSKEDFEKRFLNRDDEFDEFCEKFGN